MMRAFIVTLFALIMTANAKASSTDFGYIKAMYGSLGGAILFNVDATRSAPPACQNSTVPQRFVLDTTTLAGQSQAAVLMKAYSQHKRVAVVGIGSCSIWSDTETANFFQIEDTALVAPDALIEAVPSAWRIQNYLNAFTQVFFTGSTCAGSLKFPVGTDPIEINRFWALVMTAKATGRTIGVYYETSSGSCLINSFFED